jgi:2-(1,2-epoxy-1,2-dihydrophenyl)acetyl-CoA isomerase
MSDEHLLEHVEDKVATITMNRPDALNAVTRDMLKGMYDMVERFAEDPGVGAIVLKGAGRAFCSGGDVKNMASGGDADIPLETRAQTLRARMEVSRLLHEVAKPTIAMVRGPAAGAGMSLALACDLRIASETGRIITAFAKVGLSGDFGGSWFLTKLVGPSKARELYFLADPVGAEEALALGLFNRVVPDDKLEAETMELAKRLAHGPTVTLGYMKKNLDAAISQPLAQCLDLEAMHHARTSQTEDHREAAQAFVEKRKPVFQGR